MKHVPYTSTTHKAVMYHSCHSIANSTANAFASVAVSKSRLTCLSECWQHVPYLFASTSATVKCASPTQLDATLSCIASHAGNAQPCCCSQIYPMQTLHQASIIITIATMHVTDANVSVPTLLHPNSVADSDCSQQVHTSADFHV